MCVHICIYVYIYIKFAKLHSVGYNVSTSTCQEKARSLENMQKCENKAVCVKPGIGVTAVPEQVVLPRGWAASGLGTVTSATEPPACWGQTPAPRGKCQTWLLAVPADPASPARAYAFYSFFGIGFARAAVQSLSYCCEVLDASDFSLSPSGFAG